MHLAKNISLIPRYFFAEQDSDFIDVNIYTDIEKFTETYINPQRSLYLFRDDTKLIGFIDSEFKVNSANIHFAIAASERNKGNGTLMLKEFIALPEVSGLTIEVLCSEENRAAIKLLERLEFVESREKGSNLLRFLRSA